MFAATGSSSDWRYVEQDAAFVKERGDEVLVLWYENGELWTERPEPWMLEALLDLAKRLGARVRGDEFETYETVDRTYFHPDGIQARGDAERESKAMLADHLKTQRIIRIGIIGCFAALAAAAYFIGKQFEK
ncbi:hypothetical protein AAW51_2517 [Caldimonas brevitalea]|uniref:Uncharacterized protein n=1 Tax=Caldimonas brevitalea TaxID=413882 RepID=A0A0G3BMJ6_9BURK|nr:hypothetical protein AAW51_2517 [Caldimonas brevitalea]